jgi:CheY-like chemotaxis protein
LAAEIDGPAAHPAREPGDLPHCKVLIIDDSRDASYPLMMLLTHLGQQVEVAPDGKSGLEAARRIRPHMVICDIGLPGMDGYEVAKSLRAEDATRGAYLVAITGYGQEDDRRRALEAGFDRHMTKPVGLLGLKALLAECGLVQGADVPG